VHLLPLDEPPAHHLVDRRFDEGGAACFTLPEPLAVVRDGFLIVTNGEQQKPGGMALMIHLFVAWRDENTNILQASDSTSRIAQGKPMVIRVLAVPDYLDLSSFDEVFRTLLGWDGLGFSFHIHGREFTSFLRRT